ncbi:MAG: tetratricopeptide repeat protein, partial [Limisphaerales bacterium]
YYYRGHLDYDRALKEFAIAQKGQPNNSDLLAAISYVQRRQGKFEQALTNIQKAAELDPRSSKKAFEAGNTCRFIRNYPEAERYYDRAISIAPDWAEAYNFKVELYIQREGKTEKARKVLEEVEGKIDPAELAASWAELDVFDGNYQAALGRLPGPNVFDNSTAAYFSARARIYGLMNQPKLKRVYYDSLRIIQEKRVAARPQEARYHSLLGIAYAGLGRKEEAIQEGKKGVELLPVSKEAIIGPGNVSILAKIYVMVGEFDAAIDQLEYLLSIPSEYSVPLLRINPTWAPLRNHPRFKKLVAEK